LVLSDETAQILRDGESEQEMVARELAFYPLLQPLPGLMMLTSGAMTVPAGAIDPMGLATTFTLIKSETTGFGATVDDGVNDFAVRFRHDLGIALQVLGAEGSEDLIDCGHGPAPPSPD